VSQDTIGGTNDNLERSSHKTWLPKTGAFCYFDSLIGAPWNTKNNQRFNYMVLNGNKIREIKLENVMQGAIVDI
jgi:hypothetical protein